MSFLNPWAFLGLFSLPAIIALHWHFERHRRVIVSSMFLWNFLDEKFQGRKISFLHLSWLLVLDVLIALMFTLALARPVLEMPVLGGSIQQKIILLDDSASMLALEGNADRFTAARNYSANLIESSRPKDEIILITFGGKTELLASITGKEAAELANQVRQLSASGRGVELRAGLAAAQRLLNQKLPYTIYVITDGAYPQPMLEDFPLGIDWVFIGEDNNNQAVIDLSLEGSGLAQSELFFRVANYSSAIVIREVEVSVSGMKAASLVLELPPDSINPQTVRLTGVENHVSVRLLGTDQMPGDDTTVVGVSGNDLVKVALVGENPYPLDRAVQRIPGTSLSLYPAMISPTEANTFDLIIYRGQIPSAWPAGTVLVFDPPPESSILPIGIPGEIDGQLEIESGSVLENAGLESVRWEVIYDLSDADLPDHAYQTLASIGDFPFVIYQETEMSKVFIFAPLLRTGNFTKHPAFPILISRLISLSIPFKPQPSYLGGELISLPEEKVSVEFPSGEVFRSAEAIQLELTQPGLYRFSAEDPLGGVRKAVFGVNYGDLEESDISPGEWRRSYIAAEQDSDRSWQLQEVELGPWLLGIAVVLLLIQAWRAWR